MDAAFPGGAAFSSFQDPHEEENEARNGKDGHDKDREDIGQGLRQVRPGEDHLVL